MSDRWSEERAWEWYDDHQWLVGCNFTPSTAINQLEMWQAETFDPETIERELGWAGGLGFNTARVYLHDLLWDLDPEDFVERIDMFLEVASAEGIKPMFVLFDDCWNTDFRAGRQPEPKPGVHNSGWVQSPGSKRVLDSSTWEPLEGYVKGVLGSFREDDRVLMWDLYNEPGNNDLGARSLGLLREAFRWARETGPTQPLSVGVWFDNDELSSFQLSNSDVVTFHNYHDAENLEAQIGMLREHGKPMICTEYMARTRGSLFETCLPVFKREKVGCINWGLVDGKTQTKFPWGSEEGSLEPEPWFHEILYGDGTPYRQDEVDLIRRLTSSD
jgi:hypothetical protein